MVLIKTRDAKVDEKKHFQVKPCLNKRFKRYTHTKKLTAKVRLHVTCAREKHSCEIGMCDQECALHMCALNKSNVRV